MWNLSAWYPAMTDGGDLSVSSSAALIGSQGMQVVIDDNNAIYLVDDHPEAESRYRTRFYFDPNSISMASGDSHNLLAGFSGASTWEYRLIFSSYNGTYYLFAGIVDVSIRRVK